MQTEQQTPTTERSAGSRKAAGEGRASGEDAPRYANVTDEGSTPDADAPAWFRSKQLGSGAEQVTEEVGPLAGEEATKPAEAVREAPKLVQSPRPRKRLKIVEKPPENVNWQRRAILLVTGFAATGYGVSLLLHGTLLTALAFQYFTAPADGPRGAAILGFSEDDGQAFDFSDDDSLLEAAGGPDAAEEETVTVVEALEDEGDPVEETKNILESGIAENVPTTGGGTGDTDGPGDAIRNTNPGGRKIGGGKAWRQGSFIVRVTSTSLMNPDAPPEANFDPKPGESYFVYIYISLPEDMTSLKVNDIQGSIVGTDKWRTSIPWDDKKNVDHGIGFYKGPEGATTYYLSPRSKNRGNPFIPVNERDVRRNIGLPIVRTRVEGEVVRSVVLRLKVDPPKVNDQAVRGVTDTISIGCEPLNEYYDDVPIEITF